MIQAKVIAHSVAASHGGEIITFELQYPRFIHGELMTHRVFSRNAMSSRAVPVAKMIEQVRNNPVVPIHWGLNQPGMQARQQLEGDAFTRAIGRWCLAAEAAANHVEVLVELGLHKQIANRVLEPFQWMRTLVTATEWDNFYELRDHEDAEPHFQVLAKAMRAAAHASTPVQRSGTAWDEGAWHLPYVADAERAVVPHATLIRVSAARCARVSYLTHDNEHPVIANDLALFERLVGGGPLHASPIEHQALPCFGRHHASRNFRGWMQFRETYEAGLNSGLTDTLESLKDPAC